MEVYGVDLAVWLAKGRTAALIDLIDQLPQSCRLYEAQVNDPEVAEAIADLPEPSEQWAPSVRDWGLTQQLLAQIVDRLSDLTAVTVQANGGKPAKPPRVPAPRTGIDEARERVEKRRTDALISSFGFDL